MADEPEAGPDPNDARRHAKRMYSEKEYRQNYRRIDFYKPNEKQIIFHNNVASELMLRAGNQLGKTHAAGAQMTMDALSIYPENWYRGRRFDVPPKIDRPVDFMGWASCTTAEKTRDGAQVKLLGRVKDQGGLGTGLIPLDNIGRMTMSRGVSDCVDSVSLRREGGGEATIRFKSYKEGREVFQGEPVDVNWLDEDVSREEKGIYGECLARRTTTRGRILVSLTPLLGLSPLRKRYKFRQGTSMDEVLMTIYDCAVSKGGHIPDDQIEQIIADTPEAERATRCFGADMQGEASVFDTPIDRVTYRRDPAEFPRWWKWLWALDFRHSGNPTSGHPFAAVLLAWDTDADVIYVVDAFRMRGTAPLHVARIKESPLRDAPVAWPHDGGRGGSLISGDTIMMVYKKLGLNMRPTHATFPSGGYSFSDGIQVMQDRFEAATLLIADHLTEARDEYQGYHLINGLVNKEDDDIMSAIRVGCMDIRFARPIEHFAFRGRVALPSADTWDIFTGAA